MNGAERNQVFVHESGREAVYGSDGKLVKDCENMGSYNYAHYERAPLAHFTVDILPWFRWGNCREDKTSKEQRVNAYIKDFEDGLKISVASKIGYFLPEGFDFSSSGQSEAVSFFLRSLNHTNFKLTEFIMHEQRDPHAQQKFLEALKHGIIMELE